MKNEMWEVDNLVKCSQDMKYRLKKEWQLKYEYIELSKLIVQK